MRKTTGHSWRFKARFRRHAFGWKSRPAIDRRKRSPTGADVWAAYSHTIKAAANVDGGHDIRHRILALIDSASARGGFVASIIGRELGLP